MLMHKSQTMFQCPFPSHSHKQNRSFSKLERKQKAHRQWTSQINRITEEFSILFATYLIGARLVGAKGQVPNQKRSLGATSHGSAVNKHFIKRDRKGGVIPMNHHGGRVADQANVDAGGVQVDRRRVVVGGDHGDGLALLVLLLQVGHRHSLVWALRLWAAVDGVFRHVAHATEDRREGSRHRFGSWNGGVKCHL